MLRAEGACQTGSAALLHPRPDSPPRRVLLDMSAMQMNSQTLPEVAPQCSHVNYCH